MAQLHYVYALLDPDTKAIRYIGITVNRHSRLRQHVMDGFAYLSGRYPCARRTKWLVDLVKRHRIPKMIVLAKTTTLEAALDSEQRYIVKYAKRGIDLTNGTHLHPPISRASPRDVA